MKKILLIRPEYWGGSEVAPPLGLLYLAAAIRARLGARVRLLDCQARPATVKQTLQTAKDFAPDVVGISVLSYQASTFSFLSQELRRELPGVIQVVGGPFATTEPEKALLEGAADFCVMGEGEIVFTNLLKTLGEKNDPAEIPGIGFKTNGNIQMNGPEKPIEDLDALPFPAWDLVDFELLSRLPRIGWIIRNRPYFSIFSSRGCPYQCTYCHKIFGKRFRSRSPENVLLEIDRLHEEHGVREIQFFDDIFNLEKDRVISICRGIAERDYKLALTFPNGLRGDILDEEVIRWLKRAGTYKISVAIETASPRIQKEIKKNLDLKRIKHTIELLEKHRILAHGFFMMGFPGESLDQMRQSAKFARESRLHSASFFFVHPLPGSELYETLLSERSALPSRGKRDSYFKQAINGFSPSGAKPHDVRKLLRRAQVRFYCNPRRIGRILRDLPNRGQLFFLTLLFLVRVFHTGWEKNLLSWKKKQAFSKINATKNGTGD